MSVERFRPYRPLPVRQTDSMVGLKVRLLLALAVGLVVSQTDPAMLGMLAGALILELRE